jgi:hypothetical protein
MEYELKFNKDDGTIEISLKDGKEYDTSGILSHKELEEIQNIRSKMADDFYNGRIGVSVSIINDAVNNG